MGDELLRGQDAFQTRLGLVVRDVGDEHPVERSLTDADDVLATAAATEVLARQHEAALVAQLRAAVTVGRGQQQGDRYDHHRAVVSQEQLVLRRLKTHGNSGDSVGLLVISSEAKYQCMMTTV